MNEVTCARCGETREGLASPPVGGALGERIKGNTCAKCWNEWQEDQVRIINHYGLQMADPDDRKKLREAMKEHLNLPAA